MPPARPSSPPEPPAGRPTCYRCFKPATLCVCAGLPAVENRTAVTILQHRRERFHPVGTVRLARLGLCSCSVIEGVGAVPRPELPPGTALLYPRDDARDLAELPTAERPTSLLVLDGTWQQARRLLADNPWLDALPAVRLAPVEPSRYRVRRQARPEHVSTVESIVAALRLLEPGTPGLDGLLTSFDGMVDVQLRYMRDPDRAGRYQLRRPRPSRAVPTTWLDHPERMLIVYGETAPDRSASGSRRQLVSWTALRLTTGETFDQLVATRGLPLPDGHVRHMGLTPEDLRDRCPLDEVARAFRRWLRPDDLACAWDGARTRLLQRMEPSAGAEPSLKAVWCNVTHERCGSLDDLVQRQGLTPPSVAVRGRAARRLGQAAAVLERLLQIAPRTARLPRDRS